MKNCLLFLAVVAALLVGAPAYCQYVFLDVDHDGLSWNSPGNPGDDHLTSATTSVDVYFVSDKNRDGSDAVCTSSGDPLSMITYEFTLLQTGGGSVTYGTWTDNMGFTFKLTPGPDPYVSSGPAMWLARGSSTAASPGKYKVGTLGVTVVGTPTLNVVPGYAPLSGVSQTAFGSACLGSSFDNTLRLSIDFTDADGTQPTIATQQTTWGKIKDLYR